MSSVIRKTAEGHHHVLTFILFHFPLFGEVRAPISTAIAVVLLFHDEGPPKVHFPFPLLL